MASVRLILSYVFDWIIIIGLFAAGGGLNFVSPNKHPFSLLDLSISYPYISETITTSTLVLVALAAPAVLILLTILIFVPGRAYSRSLNRSQVIRLKLWELEKSLAGLGLSIALAFFVGQGLKQLIGKPRPDLIARCQPDLNNIAKYVVGGYGQPINERWTLVSADICMNPDSSVVNEGFRSFPSGHSTFSWSGLLYLSLFFCSKFNIWIPYLPAHSQPKGNATTTGTPASPQGDIELRPLQSDAVTANTQTSGKDSASHFALREAGATPPNYLLVIAFVPIAVAIYICTTRYSDYWHKGFDIISGSVIGILAAWWSYRWYHLPCGRGQGWAWGPRHASSAFGIGVGTHGYVERSAV